MHGDFLSRSLGKKHHFIKHPGSLSRKLINDIINLCMVKLVENFSVTQMLWKIKYDHFGYWALMMLPLISCLTKRFQAFSSRIHPAVEEGKRIYPTVECWSSCKKQNFSTRKRNSRVRVHHALLPVFLTLLLKVSFSSSCPLPPLLLFFLLFLL